MVTLNKHIWCNLWWLIYSHAAVPCPYPSTGWQKYHIYYCLSLYHVPGSIGSHIIVLITYALLVESNTVCGWMAGSVGCVLGRVGMCLGISAATRHTITLDQSPPGSVTRPLPLVSMWEGWGKGEQLMFVASPRTSKSQIYDQGAWVNAILSAASYSDIIPHGRIWNPITDDVASAETL